LVVRGAEAAAHVFIVEDLDLEGEVLLEVLDNHNKEGQLDTKSLLWIGRTANKARVDVGSEKLENGALNVLVGEALDVSVADLLIPYLEGSGPDAVQDRQEATLKGVFEHFLMRLLLPSF